MAGEQQDADKVLHQDEVEEVISDELDANLETKLAATSDHAAIADLGAASGTYVQAEHTAVRAAINGMLDVLRDAKLLPDA